MHEYHGAVQMIEHAQDLCRERGHNKVNKIQLLIGEASGYTFEVVKEYFDEVAIGTVCEGAEVTVRKTDLMLRCPNCNELFPKKILQYDCPICGTPGNPTDAGKEMTIDFLESEWVEEIGDVLARKAIDKADVVAFFNKLASGWDDAQIREEDKIKAILDAAGVVEGVKVLDVACGTGVLVPDYLDRNVAFVTGVDISEEMIKIAKRKFLCEEVVQGVEDNYKCKGNCQTKIEFLCADVEEVDLPSDYDVCMVYNAFPHFSNPAKLIGVLASHLKAGGRLTIAHSMSRKQLDSHHAGPAAKVSNGLMSEEDLAKLFGAYFEVDVKISNDQMYIVSGVKVR
ncbi:MAG: hydrogenase maturation nickel metallochaperone HypA [Agathobacter sp.]|nr:hydrogenase maturation nickel metallochaperone HypA [Agathobacter sp.]